jgi:hypothetical protein
MMNNGLGEDEMSDGVQSGTGSPQSASASPEPRKSNSLWAAVIAGVIVAGIAIYFLGVGGLGTLQSVAIFVAAMLALLFAFFLGLWLAIGGPSSFTWPKCDGFQNCVAWLLALGGGALVVFVLVWVMLKFTGTDATSTIVGLPLIVIVGVIVLLIVIALVTFTFSVLGLTSKKEALGLPDGSVRSIIALMLLVLFSILAIYLYNSVAHGGLTDASAKDAVDIAKQLITLLGTLVTAVASFYFASNAVESAHAKAHALHGNGTDPDKDSDGKDPGSDKGSDGKDPGGSGGGTGQDPKTGGVASSGVTS